MLNKVLVYVAILFLTSCIGGQSIDLRSPITFTRPDNITVKCYQPPPEVIATSVKVDMDASVSKIKEILRAQAELKQTVQRIRNEIPDLQRIEVLSFRLCTDYGSGGLDPISYQTFLKALYEVRTGLSTQSSPADSKTVVTTLRDRVTIAEISLRESQIYNKTRTVTYEIEEDPAGTIVIRRTIELILVSLGSEQTYKPHFEFSSENVAFDGIYYGFNNMPVSGCKEMRDVQAKVTIIDCPHLPSIKPGETLQITVKDTVKPFSSRNIWYFESETTPRLTLEGSKLIQTH